MIDDATIARLRAVATESLSTVKGRFDLAMEGDAVLALLDERDALTRERDDLLASGRFGLEMYDKVRAERDALGRERDCAYAAQRAAETELALQAAQAVAREGDLRYQRDAAAALLREARDWIVSVDRADAGRRQIPIVARIDALLGDVDGIDLQEMAIEHGLIAPADPAPTEPCGESCACVEYYAADEWAKGAECYRRTALLTGEG